MKLISLIITVTLLITGCASIGYQANCIEAAAVACAIMQRQGHDIMIVIQETPKEGVYHSQCMALDGEEWKWVVLDSYPYATWGEREHGEPVGILLYEPAGENL